MYIIVGFIHLTKRGKSAKFFAGIPAKKIPT
jgi:hypothetical protein